MLKITFIKHSSFLVETENAYMLFDYYEGDLPKMSEGKPLYVFVSHSHADHYNEAIFDLESENRETYYILSSENKKARRFEKAVPNICFMEPHQEARIGDCKVATFKSNDAGLAFAIEMEGFSLYHAGDLQWWDWPGEPEEDNSYYERTYKEEINRIAGRFFDLAFVVLDPRQEESSGLGLDYFINNVDARVIFPMHLWGDFELVRKFKAEHSDDARVGRLVEISAPGQVFHISDSNE